MGFFRSFLKYFVTVLSTFLIGYLRIYLIPFLGEISPYHFFIPAIIMSSAYGGFSQGILSVFISFVIINLFIISPEVFIDPRSFGELSAAISFFAIGSIVSWFIESANRSKNEIKKYYAAFEQAGDGIFITDKNGYIQFVNAAFEKMSGYASFEVIGKTPRIVKSGKQNKDFYENLWKTIRSGRTFRGTFINRKKNSELFYADHTITPVKDSQGIIINYVGIWKDITKQQEIDKRKDEFFSIASHELKTPLTSIKGYIQIIASKLKENKSRELNIYIRRVESQVDNMTNLVYEILDDARISAGKLNLKKVTFNFNHMISESVRDLQTTTDSRIVFKPRKQIINIVADRERISQVIKNLLSNAIKYSGGNSKIILDSKKINGNAIVSIRDYGIGIPKQEQTKIFDRFYQSKNSKPLSNPSFGIGLFISAKIIKQHNGKIWVDSNEGKGSTFYFSLPIS